MSVCALREVFGVFVPDLCPRSVQPTSAKNAKPNARCKEKGASIINAEDSSRRVSLGVGAFGPGARWACNTRRTQYPLIKEYTLNHNSKAPIVEGVFPN